MNAEVDNMDSIDLSKTFLKDLVREKSVIFSCFILPVVIIWSTWWVTADIPMIFELTDGTIIQSNMIDIHVVTGGLTAMGITAGLFGFLITVRNRSVAERLNQVGYSKFSINLGSFLALSYVLFLTTIMAILLSIYLSYPQSLGGFVLSMFLCTIIYAAIGNLVGTLTTNYSAGSLFMLIFSFMDLMLFTNPMGEGLYLDKWTYFVPGFWPVQLSLEAGFVDFPDQILVKIGYGILYFVFVLILTQLLNTRTVRSAHSKLGGIIG